MLLHKSKEVVTHYENGGCVILNMENGNFYGVHDLSLQIWDMLDEVIDSNEIVDRIAMMYDGIPKEEISEDINEFINEMLKEGIIKKYE